MSRVRAFVLGLAFVFVISGCPREADPPAPPPDASMCVDVTDCNEEACGLLRPCVDGFCAAEPTIAIPCRDGATR